MSFRFGIASAATWLLLTLSLAGCVGAYDPNSPTNGASAEIIDEDGGGLNLPDGHANVPNRYSHGSGTWSLQVDPVANASHPGRGSVVHVKLWGAGGGGGGGGVQYNNYAGPSGGSGASGGYVRFDYTIPTSGVSTLLGVVGSAGVGGLKAWNTSTNWYSATNGTNGGSSTFRIAGTGAGIPAGGLLVVAAGGGGGGHGAFFLNSVEWYGTRGTPTANLLNPPLGLGVLSSQSNLTGNYGNFGVNGGNCGGGAPVAGASPALGYYGRGGQAGHGGWHQEASCLPTIHANNWQLANGAAGLPGYIEITW